MLKFWIAIYFLSGYTEGTSFLTRPRNIAVEIGGVAEFPCKVDFGTTTVFEGIQWVFNDKRLYSFEKGHEDYSHVEKTFEVNQDGKNFNLTVTDLRFDDGGKYTCKIISEQATALLTVLGTPEISYDPANAIEGSITEFTCTAQFSGPSEGDTLNYPNLQMFLDDSLLDGTVPEPKYDSSADQFNIFLVRNIKLEGSMNAKALVCHIGTSINAKTEITVLYSVRDVTYTPRHKKYGVGSNITCMAEGNPKPDFQWSDTQNKGDVINGAVLIITVKMIGSNVWECTANNTISGTSHQETISATFDVDPSTEGNGGKSENDSGVIAAAVIIPVLILIISLAAFLFYTKCWKQRKQKKEQHVEKQKSTPDNEENTQFLPKRDDVNVSDDTVEGNNLQTTDESDPGSSVKKLIQVHETKVKNNTSETLDRKVGPKVEAKPSHKENSDASHPKDGESQSKAPKESSNVAVDNKVGTPAEPKQRGKETEVASQPRQDGSQAKALKETNVPIDSKVGTLTEPQPSGKESEVASEPKEDGGRAKALKETNVPIDSKVGPLTEPQPSGKESEVASEPKEDGGRAKALKETNVPVHRKVGPLTESQPSGKESEVASEPKEDGSRAKARKETPNVPVDGKVGLTTKHKPVGKLVNERVSLFEPNNTYNASADRKSGLPTKLKPTGKRVSDPGGKENTDASHPQDDEIQAKALKETANVSADVKLKLPNKTKPSGEENTAELDLDSRESLGKPLPTQAKRQKNTSDAGLIDAFEKAVEQRFKLKPKDVIVNDDLRNGNFGEIVSGTYQCKTVTLKLCEETGTEDQKNAFLNEITFLQRYEHENIVQFLGIRFTTYPLIIVVESASALLTYLKEYDTKKKLNNKKLAEMCMDILEGMIYLERKQCLHRDIAARNCIILEKIRKVKICNFFMAKEKAEYKAKENEPVQLRWAAPEVIKERKYTGKSDLWSFGVLMWEIFSFGQTPYDGIADVNIPNYIEEGHRLVPPDATPEVICNQMKRCWEYLPSKRQKQLINLKRHLKISFDM